MVPLLSKQKCSQLFGMGGGGGGQDPQNVPTGQKFTYKASERLRNIIFSGLKLYFICIHVLYTINAVHFYYLWYSLNKKE